jgi:methionine-gamma-lyase
MSTTYTLKEPVSFSGLEQEEDGPFVYTRWANPTVRQLAEKLAAMEGTEAGAVYASGMAASAAVLLGSLSSGDHLVVSDTNYAGTAELVRNTLPRFGIEVTTVDSSDLKAVRAAVRPETRMVWVETPANPILRLADLAAIADITHAVGAELAVDSTFATPVATRPVEFGADYVVHSLTKYICGHGDAVGGAVLASKATISRLTTEATIHYGGVLSPFNAWLIMRGAATLPVRMAAHEVGAMELAQHLEEHPAVLGVTYPGLPSHPQYELAKRQMDNFSGMLTFRVADGPAVAERMRKQLDVFHYAVSLGHHRSLIYWMGTEEMMRSSFHLTGAQLDSYCRLAGDGVFRVSVGLEDPADLIEDLDRVLHPGP